MAARFRFPNSELYPNAALDDMAAVTRAEGALVVDHRRVVGIVSVIDLVDVLARAPQVWS